MALRLLAKLILATTSLSFKAFINLSLLFERNKWKIRSYFVNGAVLIT